MNQSVVETFTWKNLQADVYLGLHGNSVRLFHDTAIVPTLDRLDAEVTGLQDSDDPVDAFLLSDMEVLRASTIQSALSIQSLWERQFRDFLTACTKELRPTESAAQLRRSDWDGLIKAFEGMRPAAPRCRSQRLMIVPAMES